MVPDKLNDNAERSISEALKDFVCVYRRDGNDWIFVEKFLTPSQALARATELTRKDRVEYCMLPEVMK